MDYPNSLQAKGQITTHCEPKFHFRGPETTGYVKSGNKSH